MRKIVLAPDSFKGTLSSLQVCALITEEAGAVFPGIKVVSLPVADGGEGTVECFLAALPGGQRVELEVQGPFGQPLKAAYGRFGTMAVVEMAAAAGLPLVEGKADPEAAGTFGVGQLIRHAVEQGAEKVVLGLGGSATNDGGCGCAAALGVRFAKADGTTFVPTGGTLADIDSIDATAARQLLQGVEVVAMCDVKNPLTGPQGAAAIYGPQKGADTAMVQRLDAGLAHLDECIQRSLGCGSVAQEPGAGAAGGFGAGVLAFLGGTLQPGIETVLDTVGFEAHLAGADAVFTGEGRIDAQSLEGKVVVGVARRAKKQNVPVIAVVGSIAAGGDAAYHEGVTALYSISRAALDFEKVKHQSEENMRAALRDLFRLIRAAEEMSPPQ